MYIAIEGVIGVGKTTLARLLQPAFQADLMLEVFEENPFLSDFYGDRQRYAFQTQIFFLLSRYRQQRRAAQQAGSGNSSLSDELEMYYKVHEALAEKIVIPDLVIYLRADTAVLMQRIAQRDRPYERAMEAAYIDQLNQAYEDFFVSPPDHLKVMIVDTNHMNFIANTEHQKLIENRIRQSLRLSPYQAELPLG
jgi:deoxyguanosine kinase